MPLRSLRSPPAQNARAPAPVSTMQRCPFGAASIASNRSSRSRPICVFIALATSGRFNVTSSVCGCGSEPAEFDRSSTWRKCARVQSYLQSAASPVGRHQRTAGVASRDTKNIRNSAPSPMTLPRLRNAQYGNRIQEHEQQVADHHKDRGAGNVEVEGLSDGSVMDQADHELLDGRQHQQQDQERQPHVQRGPDQRLMPVSLAEVQRMPNQHELGQYQCLYRRAAPCRVTNDFRVQQCILSSNSAPSPT